MQSFRTGGEKVPESTTTAAAIPIYFSVLHKNPAHWFWAVKL
jgi:hypothetical protein